MEWWIEDAQWSQEARDLILELFPNSNIRSMGPKDSNSDIIVLKPYELNEPLDLEQVYAVSIFEDSGQSNFVNALLGPIKNFVHLHIVTINSLNMPGLVQSRPVS